MVATFEALFLLALDDEDGDIVERVAGELEHVLAGAVLVELLLQRRLALQAERLAVIDETPTDHPVLNKALFELLDSARPRKVKYWINTLAYKGLLDEVSHHLIEQGILVRKKKRLCLANLPSAETNQQATLKYRLKNRLRAILLAEQEANLAETVLLAFVYYGDWIKLAFTPGERKAARKRLRKMMAGEAGSGLGGALEMVIALACQPKSST